MMVTRSLCNFLKNTYLKTVWWCGILSRNIYKYFDPTIEDPDAKRSIFKAHGATDRNTIRPSACDGLMQILHYIGSQLIIVQHI